jgi:hypothetical protein
MIKWVLQRAIDKFERDWKYDGSYMREIIDASLRAAWLFSRAAAVGQFRCDVPIEPWYAAGITAVHHEDCGPCAQLGVTMAERAGVSPEVLRAVLADNPDAMPPDVALVWRFTRATLAHDASADEYREAIVKRWGKRALVSLALAITASRIYPTVKYALGHGKACTRVVIGGAPVLLDHGLVPTPWMWRCVRHELRECGFESGGKLRAVSSAAARTRLPNARVDGRRRGRGAGNVLALARGGPQQRVRP